MAFGLAQLARNIESSIAGVGQLLGLTKTPQGPGAYPGIGEEGKSGVGKVLNKISPENWNKSKTQAGESFYVFGVVDKKDVNKPLGGFSDFPLPLNPTEINQDELPAISIKPTQGGTHVQHGGIRYGDLVISGTTGVHPGRGAGGVRQKNGLAIAQDQSKLTSKSGYEVFLLLRNWFKAYYQFKHINAGDAKNARLVFKNFKDGEILAVELTRFTMKRSASRKTLYDYTLNFTILARMEHVSPAEDTSVFAKIDNVVNTAIDAVDTARGVFLQTQDTLRQIESAYESTIVEPMRKTALAIKAFTGIGTVAADMGNKAISETVSTAAALRIVSELKAKQQAAKTATSNADIDTRISSASLPASNITAQSIVQLGRESDILMAVDSSDFPTSTQEVLAQDQADALELPRSFFEDARANLIRVRDNAADAFNLGDSTFDSQFGRVPTSKAESTKQVTDQEFALLGAFEKAIEGINFLLSTNAFFKSPYEQRIANVKALFDDGELGGVQALSAVKELIMPTGTDLERIASQELGDYTRWIEIVELNNLKPPYVVQDLSDTTPNVLKPGDRFLIPTPIINGFGRTPTTKERYINADLNAVERNLGIDFKVSDNFDLSLTNRGDLEIIRGAENAAQAVILKLSYEKGELLNHPELGVGLTPGSKGSPVNAIKTQLIQSLTQDPRFESVTDLTIFRENSEIRLKFRLKVKNVDTPVPVDLKL